MVQNDLKNALTWPKLNFVPSILIIWCMKKNHIFWPIFGVFFWQKSQNQAYLCKFKRSLIIQKVITHFLKSPIQKVSILSVFVAKTTFFVTKNFTTLRGKLVYCKYNIFKWALWNESTHGSVSNLLDGTRSDANSEGEFFLSSARWRRLRITVRVWIWEF